MSKTIKKPYVEFVGMNACGVTGSSYLIKYKDSQILYECGLYQSNDMIKDYNINKNRHKSIKPKLLDALVIGDLHTDHTGKIPELYHNGCKAPLYIPKGAKSLLKLMWYDSCKIFEAECEQLKKKGIKAYPLYGYDDVENALDHIVEIDKKTKIKINDEISITHYNAKHIIRSSQTLFEFKDDINYKRVLFTSDIGSPNMDMRYMSDFEAVPYADVVIGEATYSDNKRKHSVKDRPKDIDKLHTVISEAIEKRAKVLIPVFSLSRLQMMLTVLYEMYGSNLDIPVIIDTPLGVKINALWKDLIECDEDLWEKVSNWSNIRIAHEYSDSKYYQDLNEPMIILSSGGMLSAGRAVGWAKKLVSNSKHHICFCGFAGENTLAYQIKNQNKHPYIKVDKVKLKNNCNVTILNSFSSHMCYDELMDYYCSIEYNSLYLVHSEQSSKIKFAEELRKRLSLVDRSSKVICAVQDMKCYF